MSASSVAIISFGAILLIGFALLIYRYYTNKNKGGERDIIFNFLEEDQTNYKRFATFKNADIKKQDIVNGGFKYTDDFTGTFIFTFEIELSEILKEKEFLKLIHNDNNGVKKDYEFNIDKNSPLQTVTIVPFDSSSDMRGFHYFDIYVDNTFYGTKSYRLLDDEVDFILTSDYDSVNMTPAQIITPESFSYQVEYSSIPRVKLMPYRRYAAEKSGYNREFAGATLLNDPNDAPLSINQLLKDVRIIRANNRGGVKIQSNSDEDLYLIILPEPYSTSVDSIYINYKVATFVRSTLEDATIFYLHNVTNEDNYFVDYFGTLETNESLSPTNNNLVKIGDQPTGEGCYFMLFRTSVRKTSRQGDLLFLDFLDNVTIPNTYSSQLSDTGIPMVRWRDINKHTCKSENLESENLETESMNNIKRARTCMVFHMEDVLFEPDPSFASASSAGQTFFDRFSVR